MIKKVTVTGADDSIMADELVEISRTYPFVEWGILYSDKQIGNPRYPSLSWIDELVLANVEKPLWLSLHLCGRAVRDLCGGNERALEIYGTHISMFQRVQINFHSIPHASTPELFQVIRKYPDHEFIFQYDEVNDEIVRRAFECRLQNISVLFDKSGGAGILPSEWPRPLSRIKSGYAGGLSPLNVRDQIALIEAKAGDRETWIDCETHVRSKEDRQFDLDKVRTFLENAKPFVVA